MMNSKEFLQNLYDKTDWLTNDIFAPPCKAQYGLDILIHHFLGEKWYSCSGVTSCDQVNTEAICEILNKYPHPLMSNFRYNLRRFLKWLLSKI